MGQRTVLIDAALYDRVAAHLDRLGFPSVGAVVTHLLRERLAEADAEGEVFSADEEAEVKDRLRALGYLD